MTLPLVIGIGVGFLMWVLILVRDAAASDSRPGTGGGAVG